MNVKRFAIGLLPLTAAIAIALSTHAANSAEGPTTTLPATVTTVTAPPADHTEGSGLLPAGVEMTTGEQACVDEATDFAGAIECLGLPTILANEADYLARETAATPEQIACVTDRLGARSLDEVHAIILAEGDQPGVGEAAYVPCGLPD